MPWYLTIYDSKLGLEPMENISSRHAWTVLREASYCIVLYCIYTSI